MQALGKTGAVLMGIGGILVGILGILFLVPAAETMAWFQGLSFLVLGVGLLLWAIAAVFGKATVGVGAPAGQSAQRERL